ncbi:MAG: hypothetical protein JO147_09675 [Actinobacteria bacterium]|nr:hypothetical protein [Actinomycetota bacterium]
MSSAPPPGPDYSHPYGRSEEPSTEPAPSAPNPNEPAGWSAPGNEPTASYPPAHPQTGYEQGQFQPGQFQPGEFQPGQFQPGQFQPGQFQPGGYQPVQPQPGGYQPGGYQPGGYQPGGPQPGGNQPAGGYQPSAYQPGAPPAPDYQSSWGQHQQEAPREQSSPTQSGGTYAPTPTYGADGSYSPAAAPAGSGGGATSGQYGPPARTGYMPLPGYAPGNANVGLTGRGFGILGSITALIGAAAVVVAFTALSWIKDSAEGIPSLKFKDLHDLIDFGGSGAPTISRWYFGWLGWTFFGVMIVLALLANSPTFMHGLFRGLAFVVGLAAAVCTLFALKTGGTSWSDLFKYAGVGFWIAIAGFVVMAIGSLTGPRYIRR